MVEYGGRPTAARGAFLCFRAPRATNDTRYTGGTRKSIIPECRGLMADDTEYEPLWGTFIPPDVGVGRRNRGPTR
jgi:hypothetical protein